MAIDLSAPDVSSLIRSFVASDHTRLAQSALAEQVRYAEPHNLAAMVKWTLARLSRFLVVPVAAPAGSASNKKGEVTEEMAVIQQRGWLELETYLAWKEEEKGEYQKEADTASSTHGLTGIHVNSCAASGLSQLAITPGPPLATFALPSTKRQLNSSSPFLHSSPRLALIASKTG